MYVSPVQDEDEYDGKASNEAKVLDDHGRPDTFDLILHNITHLIRHFRNLQLVNWIFKYT